jgi:filamentous hemagglutinin family protein
MNKIYRVIWSHVRRCYVAVHEGASAHGNTASSRARPTSAVNDAISCQRPAAFALTATAALFLHAGSVFAADLPKGGEIVAGSGSISQAGTTMTITQDTAKMAANWESFSIGQDYAVHFVQPSASAVALNRVIGSDVSVIQGALRANGQVFLLNPNGVLFTPSAQVDTGSLVASTLELANEDFLAGNYRFQGGSSSSVVNQGSITAAEGGTVALIAAKIENTGSILAQQGRVLLGAGSQVTLDLGGPVKLQVEQSAVDALISNGGAIQADGGTVLLTAKAAQDLASTVINSDGIIEARTLDTGEQGEIVLLGEQGTVEVAGSIDVSSASGQGGKAARRS